MNLSLSKQPRFCEATTGFPRNDVWETSAEIPYWWRVTIQIWLVLWLVEKLLPPIRSSTQIWVVTRHQYGISALVPQTSFRGETSDSLAKCSLFSHANDYFYFIFFFFQAIHQQLQETLEEQESLKVQIAEYARQVARVEELLAEKVSLLTLYARALAI